MDPSGRFINNVNDLRKHLQIHPEDVNKIFGNRLTILMYAAIEERTDIVDLLLFEFKCNVNIQGEYLRTALHHACFSKSPNRQIIQKLIASGAESLKDINGNIPLQIVCDTTDDINIIYDLMIISDPNNINIYGSNCLMTACFGINNNNVVAALIDVTHDINYGNNENFTALHRACRNRNYDIISLLLEAGANSNIRDSYDRTPYDYADVTGKTIIDEWSR